MRRVSFDRFGPPAEVLRLERVEVPEPGAAEVRLRLLARPIHPADLATIRGGYGRQPRLPAVPGYEGAGRIEAIGQSVEGWESGQRAIPIGVEGSWQDSILVPAQSLVAVPDALPDGMACQALVNPLSARLLLLELLQAKPGDWVVQNAAASTLGRLIVQLAALNGINLINLVRRPASMAALEALGAEHILLDDEEIGDRIQAICGRVPVLKALDAVGGEPGARMAGALGYGATVVVHGALAGEPSPLDPGRLIFKNLTVKGFWLTGWLRLTPREWRDQLVSEVMALVAAGKLGLPVEAEYDLSDFRDAIDHAERPGRSGKILLIG